MTQDETNRYREQVGAEMDELLQRLIDEESRYLEVSLLGHKEKTQTKAKRERKRNRTKIK